MQTKRYESIYGNMWIDAVVEPTLSSDISRIGIRILEDNDFTGICLSSQDARNLARELYRLAADCDGYKLAGASLASTLAAIAQKKALKKLMELWGSDA